jgi:hypothetical protein
MLEETELNRAKYASNQEDGMRREQMRSIKSCISKIPHNINYSIYRAAETNAASRPYLVDVKLLLNGKLWPVLADPGQMDQVMISFFSRSFEAMESWGGVLTIVSSNLCNVDLTDCGLTHPIKSGDLVYVGISIAGPGADCESASSMFWSCADKQFAKVHPGFASTSDMIHENQGCISALDSPGKGPEIHLFFPRFNSSKDSSSGQSVLQLAAAKKNLMKSSLCRESVKAA